MHYKIYKYLTSCCLLDSFIDILMPGCPDMFLSFFEESKNYFLGLEHYKIYKYLTPFCLLDSFIDILMPGCPEVFCAFLENKKIAFWK